MPWPKAAASTPEKKRRRRFFASSPRTSEHTQPVVAFSVEMSMTVTETPFSLPTSR